LAFGLRARHVVTGAIRPRVDGAAHDRDVATVLAALPPEDRAAVGERIELALDPRRLHVFQLETGLALR
jgi:hypothetical protein